MPVKRKRDGGRDSGAAQVALWGLAVWLAVCAGAWFFEEELNSALMTPAVWAYAGDNAALGIVGAAAIVVANVVWLPGGLVGPWALAAGAVGCAGAAVWMWWRGRG